MNALSIIYAICGGILGALIWAGISAGTGYEIGYIAWGVGGLVGFGAALGEGKGAAMGTVCGVIALLAIFGGKMVVVQYSLPTEIKPYIEEQYTLQLYNDMVIESKEFAKLTSESEYPAFMLKYGYTEAANENDITGDEIYYFKMESIPGITRLNEGILSYEEWKNEGVELSIQTVMNDIALHEIVVENLDHIDAIFGILGLLTAFRLGNGAPEDVAA